MLFFGKYLQKRGLIATPLCHISLVLHINVFSLLFCCAESRINWKRKTIKNWKNVLIFDNLQTAVYNAERSVIQWNFSDLKNPRFIIESGFKSRAGYNGARTVVQFPIIKLFNIQFFLPLFGIIIYLGMNWSSMAMD